MKGVKLRKKIEVTVCMFLICVLIFVAYLKFFLKVRSIDVFGYSFFIVKTGSMEPEIIAGELIIVKKQDDYKKDEIITYKENDIYVTHRIVEKKGNSYVTKGDANNENDFEITNNDILGKVVFHSFFGGKLVSEYLGIIIIIYIIINIIIWAWKNN